MVKIMDRIRDIKWPLSVRVRQSVHAKLSHVREIWRARAYEEAVRGEGEPAEKFESRRTALVDSIDNTHVFDVLFGKKLDEELNAHGGFPETPKLRVAQLQQVRDAARTKLGG